MLYELSGVTVQIGSFGPNFLKWTKRTGLVLEDSLFTSLAFNLYAITNISFYSSLLALRTMYLVLCSYLPFLVILVLSLVMGIVLNFTVFLCTIVNSALTTTIVGVLKGVGSTTQGFVLLGGVEVHALNVSGLVVNTAGGVWYSYAKYRQKKS
ncbi:hypothetical protein F2Q70_00034143 [Brassica cretica]|uniref:Sugar phosphate transporter domain-containing protein n=1 Tax=Brassica cretica TaxID=69181 RepID=A0A8S9JX90_BRACR|nr:hypothetical protein F2Q68_00029102 [Brassica cretica]KAF2586614.1 hypothetical protein F2Q70_00034143 [Brassica cretica]